MYVLASNRRDELVAVVLEVRLDRVLPAFERMLVVLVTAIEALIELELGAVAHLPDTPSQLESTRRPLGAAS